MNKFAITSNRWKFIIFPAVIILAGIIMYFVNGGFNFDVEFMGGSRIQVQMPAGTNNADVEKYLEDTLKVDVTVQSGEGADRIIVKAPPIEGELAISDESVEGAADAANESPVFKALQDEYKLEDSALIENNTASA